MSERFEVAESRPAVSYGPVPDSDRWVLGLSTTDSERVEILVGERAMYDLWIEVRGVPWPSGDRKDDRLIRQLVHAANGANDEMLEDALRALGVGQQCREDELEQYHRWLVIELAEEFLLSHREIADHVPYSPAWVSKVISEDGGSA